MLWLIRLLNTRFFAWGVLLFTLFFTLSAIQRIWQLTHQADPSQALAQEVQELQQQVLGQQQELEAAKTPFSQEKVIRNDLNMQKPGEMIIQLPQMPTPTPFATPTPVPTQSIPRQWWELVQ